MNLFTYLLAKKGKNSLLHGDLFSYLLGKGTSQTQTISGATIYIPDAKAERIVSLIMTKESTQDGEPSPENPVEVKTVKGYRNLIDDSIKYGAVNNVYMGTSASETKLFKVGTYTISTNYPCTIQVLSSEGTKSSAANSTDFTFTLSEDDNIRIRFQKNEIQPSDITFVLIVEGTEVKPYVPYGNNYVNVKVKGKNLLNINNEYIKRNDNGSMTISDNVITLTNSTSTNNAYGWIVPVELNKNVTVSFSNTTANVSYANVYCRFIDEPISIITDFDDSQIISRTTKNITLTSTSKYLLVYIRVPQTTFTVSNLMVSYSNDLKYETYQETIVPIPLNNNEIVGKGTNFDEYIVDKNGKCYLNKVFNKIDSYNGETITTDYWSTTGGLDTGATVYYVRDNPDLIDLNATVDIRLFKGVNNITNSEDCNMSLTYENV